MKYFKSLRNNMTVTFLAAFIFVIGVVFGNNLNRSLTFIGDFFFARGSSESATNANYATGTDYATGANYIFATGANYATGTNYATGANYATDANYGALDYVMDLLHFSFDSNNVMPSQNLIVNLITYGANLSYGEVTLVSENLMDYITMPIEELTTYNTKYVTIPSSALPGKYMLLNVYLSGVNSDGSTFYKLFRNSNIKSISYYDEVLIDYDDKLTIGSQKNSSDFLVSNFKIGRDSVVQGEKLTLLYDSNQPLTSLNVLFKNTKTNEYYNVNARDLDYSPYIKIGSNLEKGEYELYGILAVSGDNRYFDNNMSLQFNVESTNNKNEYYIVNNYLIGDSLVEKYDKLILDATNNPLVSSAIFNYIKDYKTSLVINYNDNEMIFDGNDIENTDSIKDINSLINVYKIDSDYNLYDKVKKGVAVEFASNGKLPAKATVKIKNNSELGLSDSVYVYYYNEENGLFREETMATLNGDYYEFEIDHNSTFVLVNNKLSNKLIDSGSIVKFQESNTVHLLLIGMGILLLIIFFLFILLVKKNKKKEEFNM